MKILCFLSLLCLAVSAEAKPKVVDGDSLVWNGRRIRLLGIDAPEYRQKCSDKDGKDYPCGLEALKFLKKQVAQGKFHCRKVAEDIYKRDLSICYVDGEDVNRKMITNGWAVAYRTKKSSYLKAEKNAKEKRKGIWQGKFMKPELYRILTK